MSLSRVDSTHYLLYNPSLPAVLRCRRSFAAGGPSAKETAMAGSYKRLLDGRTLTAGWKQPLDAAIDVGGFRRLEIQIRLAKTGTAGTLSLESAPINEDDAYQAVAGSSVSLDGTGTTDGKKHLSIDAFFRFLRVVADAQAAGGPVATVDVVAKE